MKKSNLEIIETLYDAFARRDVPTVLSLISPEIQISQSAALPWGGRYFGYEGLHRFFSTLTEHVDSSVHIENVVDAGESIVVVGRARGMVRKNGRAFDVSLAHIWRIQNGRVTRFMPYLENSVMLGALNGGMTETVTSN